MQLRELLKIPTDREAWAHFDRSDEPFGEYYDGQTLGPILYPSAGNIEYEHMDAVNKSGDFQAVRIRRWWCSDQHVGLDVILLFGAPVLIRYRPGRKSHPTWTSAYEGAVQDVREIFDRYIPEDAFDEEEVISSSVMQYLEVGSETNRDGAFRARDVGLSEISCSDDFVRSMEKNLEELIANHEDNFVERQTEYWSGVLGKHEVYVKMVSDSGDQEWLVRMTESSEKSVANVKKVLDLMASIG